MMPEQLETARFRREVNKLKAERDIQKSFRRLREGIDVKFFSFIRVYVSTCEVKAFTER
jgi:hypothetical protein